MKLKLEQRTKLFNLIRNRVFTNLDKVKVISSDFPNQSFTYEDQDYLIVSYYNLNGFGVSTHGMLQLSLLDKKSNKSIKFDNGDYMFMKNHNDFFVLCQEIKEKVFNTDTSDNSTSSEVDEILRNF
jgi:hypothetical protein